MIWCNEIVTGRSTSNVSGWSILNGFKAMQLSMPGGSTDKDGELFAFSYICRVPCS